MNTPTQTQEISEVAIATTNKDFVASILIVSVFVNLTVLVTYLWVSIDPMVRVAVTMG